MKLRHPPQKYLSFFDSQQHQHAFLWNSMQHAFHATLFFLITLVVQQSPPSLSSIILTTKPQQHVVVKPPVLVWPTYLSPKCWNIVCYLLFLPLSKWQKRKILLGKLHLCETRGPKCPWGSLAMMGQQEKGREKVRVGKMREGTAEVVTRSGLVSKCHLSVGIVVLHEWWCLNI